MAEIIAKVTKICLSGPMKEINVNILKDELLDLKEALNEQLEALIESREMLPQIEFDIIMENLRRMYDDINKLYRLNVKEEKKTTIPVAEPVLPFAGIVPERTTKPPFETSPVIEKRNEISENPPASTLFSFEDLGFTQKLQEAREKTMPRPTQKVHHDLKSLININDKFLFINELFDGNLREYSQAIERMNNSKEKQEAFAFLTELLKANYWNSQSPAFIKLKAIIEKWFA